MNLALFSTDNSPAAFSLNTTHCCHGRRVQMAKTIAVWHLVESVASNSRLDLNRFEQNLKAWITHSCTQF